MIYFIDFSTKEHTQTHIISFIISSLVPQIWVGDLWLIVCTWSTVGTSKKYSDPLKFFFVTLQPFTKII